MLVVNSRFHGGIFSQEYRAYPLAERARIVRQFFWAEPLGLDILTRCSSNTAERARVPAHRGARVPVIAHDPTHRIPKRKRKRKRENSWDIYASHCLSPISFAAAGRGLRRQLHSCGPLRVMNHRLRIVYTPRFRAEPSRPGFVHECTRRCTRVSLRDAPPGCSSHMYSANLTKPAKRYLYRCISKLPYYFLERSQFLRNYNPVWWNQGLTDTLYNAR